MKTEGAPDSKLAEGVAQGSFYQLSPVHISSYYNAQHKVLFFKWRVDNRIDMWAREG